MGRKRRCKRRAEEAAPASGWFTRFALAFLIIFVLLWLLAPREEHLINEKEERD